MPYDDLRQWIARLRAEDELLEISAPVDPHLELGAVCRYFLDNPPQRALLFTNVEGHSQPVLANVFGTRRRLDLALGTTDGNREQFVLDRWHRDVPPVLAHGSAPSQEVVLRGDEVDLLHLPIPCHNVEDAGRYISFGVAVTKDPEGDFHNLFYSRIEIKDRARAVMMILPGREAQRQIDRNHALGRPAPISIFLGADPVLHLAAAASPAPGHSEYSLAGAFRGAPVILTRSVTSDVLVPAGAEIVIEGELRHGETEIEGPFGEFTGHYGPAGHHDVLRVNAITYRKNPIFQTLYTGIPVCDNHIMQELLRTAKVWERVKQAVPNVTRSTARRKRGTASRSGSP